MRFTWERVTADRVMSPNPAKVGSIIVTPDSDTSKADITLHDGESTQDPQIITIRTGGGITKSISFTPYLETQRGLYIDIGTNVEEVLVQLCWEPE